MIAICPNPYRDNNLSYTRECLQLLKTAGYDCCVCPVFTDETWTAPADIRTERLKDVSSALSHILVLGGDGTDSYSFRLEIHRPTREPMERFLLQPEMTIYMERPFFRRQRRTLWERDL